MINSGIDIDQLPINCVTRKCNVFGQAYVAKSGIYIQGRSGDYHLYCGFSYHEKKEAAEKISKSEVLERVLSTSTFNKKYTESKEYYESYSWPSKQDVVSIHRSQLFLDEQLPNKVDASGLAYHNDFSKSEEHAVFEIIERDLLARIWYKSLALTKILGLDRVISNYEFNYYYAQHENGLILGFVTIANSELGTWLCGSKASIDLEEALNGAEKEALLLNSAIVFNDEGYCYSKEIETRIMSLRDREFSEKRIEFLGNKANGNKHWGEIQHLSIKKDILFDNIKNDSKKVYITLLYSQGGHYVVRASSEHLLKIRDMRKIYNGEIGNLDPFC